MARAIFQLDVEDVARLIASDGTPETGLLDIRNYVVQEFTRRYLKDLANDETMTAVAAGIKAAVADEVKKQIGIKDWKTFNLVPEARDAVIKVVTDTFRGVITEAIGSQRASLDSQITELVNVRLNNLIEDRINRVVNERFKAFLEQAARLSAEQAATLDTVSSENGEQSKPAARRLKLPDA